MRIRIAHLTTYDYNQPAKALVQQLRLTPRPHEGQHVIRWRVEIDADGRLRPGEDALGNLTHSLFIAGPISRLTVTVTGDVETADTQGVVRGAVERFPETVFLRDSPLAMCDAALGEFADDVAAGAGTDPLDRLHRLLAAVVKEVDYDKKATTSGATAAEAFALRKGVCQDLSHIFIAAARRMGIPARYISGHLARADGAEEQEAAHAWAEAFVPNLGWVGFDPANGYCTTEAHVRVAAGLDYRGAAPVRGARYGGGEERLDVKLHVSQGSVQNQA
jgi:transglutaminase-like putative cysteine protease